MKSKKLLSGDKIYGNQSSLVISWSCYRDMDRNFNFYESIMIDYKTR